MPFDSIADVPARTKKFWANVGATTAMKKQWVNVFNSCIKASPKDEGKCFRQANGVLSKRVRGRNVISESLGIDDVRSGTLDGRPAWIIPTIFTREGVQNKALKLWDELVPRAWTLLDAPVAFPHPPGLDMIFNHEHLIIGRITKWERDEKKKALTGEISVWKNDWRSKWIISELRQGRGRDGSIGYTYAFDPTDGEFNGVKYINIERNLFIDHFAVGLGYYGKKGACAPPACGLLLNEENSMETRDMRQNRSLSLTAIQDKIRAAIHPPPKEHEKHMFVRELFDDFAIVEDNDSKLFKVPYTVSDKGDVTLGKRVEVQTTYVPVKTEGGEDALHTGGCPDGKHMVGGRCVDKNEGDVAREILVAMNIFAEDQIEAAVELFGDSVANCESCQDKLDKIPDFVIKNQTHTFSPAWSAVNKTDLPASAFMVVGDKDKSETWKLPFKNADGAISCNAVHAIIEILGSSPAGIGLTKKERNKARKVAVNIQRHCLAARALGNNVAARKLLYSADDINATEDIMGKEDNPAGVKPDPAAAADETDESQTGSVTKNEVYELQEQLKAANKLVETFEADEKAREEAEIKEIRTQVDEILDARKGEDLFSKKELGEMGKNELLVVKKTLEAVTDYSLSGANTGENLAEMRYGKEFIPLTVGDLYEQPSYNPTNPAVQLNKEGDA